MTEAFLKEKLLDVYHQLCYGTEENIHGESQAYLYLPNDRYIEVTYKEKETPYFVWQVRCIQTVQGQGICELKPTSIHQRTSYSLCIQDLESCIRAAVPIHPVAEEITVRLNDMQKKGLPVFSGTQKDLEKYIATFLYHCRNRMAAYPNRVEALRTLLRCSKDSPEKARTIQLLNYI